MTQLSKFKKIFIGTVALTGVLAYHTKTGDDRRVWASWTTNYEVSQHAKWDKNWDHREPQFLSNPKLSSKGDKDQNNNTTSGEDGEISQKPKAIRHLILIRHGQYNVEGRSDEERFLTNLGRLQADYTGKRLKDLGIPYTVLVKSTMSRAQETGTIISSSIPEVPVISCDFLREGAPIPPEPPLGSWKQEMSQFYTDGARIEAAFRKYFHRADVGQKEDSYTLIVCHANVIRYFVCRALQFPAEGWLRMSLNHASITWVSITPSGRVILRCLGDSGHMPPEVVTSR